MDSEEKVEEKSTLNFNNNKTETSEGKVTEGNKPTSASEKGEEKSTINFNNNETETSEGNVTEEEKPTSASEKGEEKSTINFNNNETETSEGNVTEGEKSKIASEEGEEKSTINVNNNETETSEGNVSEGEKPTIALEKYQEKDKATLNNKFNRNKTQTTNRNTSKGNKKPTRWSVCPHRCLPPWLQDNNYIVSGHRPPLNSFSECFWSIFRIHSETVNIWTHLLGFFIFSVLAILYYFLQTSPLYEKLTLFPFFLGSVLCLGFSFAFHTFYCHSPTMIRVFSCLDYCGISLLILGSILSWVSYTFYCYFWLKILYLSFTTALGLTVILVSFQETFSSPEYRPVRAAIFTLFGLCGAVPFIHLWLLEGLDKVIEMGKPVFITAVLYIFGAVLYAMRVPERMFPGRFDIWFQSHQIFHLLVVLATLVNYLGLSNISSQTKSC